MTDPAGSSGAAGGSGWSGPDGTWPTRPPTGPPVSADASVGVGAAPTDPELPRTLESPVAPGQSATPFFHDLSGAPAAPASVPFPPPGEAPLRSPAYAPTAYPAPPAQPSAYGAPGYPPAYPPPPGYGYGSPYGPYAYGGWAPPKNNGLAIASMVCGIVGIAFCQIFAIPALIMGFVSRRQIRDSEGTQTGDAFALCGIITGGISMFILVALIVVYAGMFGLMASSGI